MAGINRNARPEWIGIRWPESLGISGRNASEYAGNEEIIDARGKLILPGLINCHMHSRPFRALGDDLVSADWHKRYAYTLSTLMDEESTYLGALNAFAECIRGGVTCAANMPPSVVGSDKAAWEIGIRAFLFPHGGDDPGMVEANESLEKSLENVQMAGDQTGKRVKFIFGFGHPNECSKEYFRRMREYATNHKVGIHGHVALNAREVSIYNEKYGKPIVEYFYETGFLANDVVFGHGTYLNPKEIQLMAQNGAKLAHNPRANMRYGSGVTPVPEMLKEGVCIGLGTDGPLSSYRIDMFEAMRLACFMQRLHKKDIAAMSALQALELATLGGAKLLGLENEIGSLEVGKKADLAVINLQQAHLAPMTKGRHSNVIALIVFSCSALDVEMVLIDGKVVLRDCKLQTVDERQIIARVTEFAERALAKVE